MSNSFVINIFLKFYKKIDKIYENSAIHRFIWNLFQIGSFSFVVKQIKIMLTKEPNKELRNNSLIFGIFDKWTSFLHKIFSGIFKYFEKASEGSFICFLAKTVVLPLKSLGYALNSIFIFAAGFFLIRLIALTVMHGFAINIFAINGGIFIICTLLSLMNSDMLDFSLKDNIIAKLIDWFFVEK